MSMHGKSHDKVIFYGLLLLLLWLPLPMGSNRTWAWAFMGIAVQLLAMAWLILALIGRASVTSAFRRAWPVLLLLLLWLGWLAVQLVPLPPGMIELLSPSAAEVYRSVPGDSGWRTLSLDPWVSRSFLLRSWSYFLLFSLILLLVRTTGRIKTLVFVLILSGVFQALFGSFMVLSGVERLLFDAKEGFIGRATGTFPNRNHLAGYLNMCLALGIGWLVAGGRVKTRTHWRQRIRDLLSFLLSEKMRLRIFLVFMAIALVMTHSRMGNTAFFSSLLITGAVWLLIRRQRPKRGAVIVLGSILLLDVAVMGHWFGLEKVVQRLQETTAEIETRDDVIRESLDYARDFWLTGSGGGSFYSTFPGYMQEGSRLSYRYAHNDFLQFFLETGVVGFALLTALVLCGMYYALRVMATRSHHYLRSLGYGSFMGVLAILIHSSTDFNLQIPSNAALFVVLLALACVAYGFPGRGSADA